MQDFVSRGNGNSRYLKSVSNFLERYPTYEDFAKALVSGNLPVDFNGLNPDGISQRGTPYNKANVLTDATAALFGLDSTATPNDVFSAIGSGGFGSSIIYAECATAAGEQYKTIEIEESFSSSDYGKSICVKFAKGNTATSPYLTITSPSGTVTARINANYVGNSSAYDYQWPSGSVFHFVYISSSSRSLFAISNIDFTYGIYATRGSYRGTGTYGAGNGTPLSMTKQPVLGMIRKQGASDFCVIVNGVMLGYVDGTFYTSGYTLNGENNLASATTWYLVHSSSAAAQMNESGSNYVYAMLSPRY